MNSSLRSGWMKRLQAAQTEPTWNAPMEVRVLRFFLSRYGGWVESEPLPPFLVVEGKEPFGCARKRLSSEQKRVRLERIAQAKREAPPRPLSSWEILTQEREYQAMLRRRRRNEKRERGY